MAFILFFFLFSLFLFTSSPTITVGDGGEFSTVTKILGIPHSPGYPLYCILGKLISHIIPFANHAYRINLMSAFFGALTAYVLFITLRKYIKEDIKCEEDFSIPIIFCIVLFCISPSFWRVSQQSEVFTLNTFFITFILWTLINNHLYLTMFISGLGLGNHHTLIFIFPLILYVIKKDNKLNINRFIIYLLFFFLGFTIYLYLPIRSIKNPQLDWGNPENFKNFWRVITRADYGSFSLTIGEKMSFGFIYIIKQILRFFSDWISQITIIGFLIGLIGAIYALSKSFKYSRILIITWSLIGPGFYIIANLPFDAESKGILERFLILPGLIWIFPMIWFFIYINKINRIFKKSYLILFLLILGILYIRFQIINWRNYYLAFDYGKNILKTLPKESVLFMDGGDDTFYSLAYLCFAQGLRGDLELHDRGGLVFKNIYGHDFRKLTKEEKEDRRQLVEKTYLLKKPVYYSTFNRYILHGMILKPEGILFKAQTDGPDLNMMDIYSLRNIYDFNFNDYRSKALAPIYIYFAGIHNKSDAIKYWDYALYKWPDILWLKNNIKSESIIYAFNFLNSNELDVSKHWYKWILSFYPKELSALLNLGVIEERNRNFDEAKKYYNKALEIDSNCIDAYYNLAVIYWNESDWQRVIENLKMVLRINPNDKRALYYLPIAENKLRKSL